ncbi:cytochrome C biogenesis protein [Proteobacteria bacterium 005FR1]|nr:cytochrome C biogenesis protein [Proteobacteria bacterium 005FR1]
MQSLSNKLIRFTSAILLCLAGVMLALPAAAQDELKSSDLSGLSNNGGAQSSSTSTSGGFLKVTEAYVLSVQPAAEALTLHWDIAPEYYLYKDNFRVKAYSDGREIPLELSYEQGKVKYDEYFEKDMEVYYGQTNVRAAVPPGVGELELAITSQGCADAGLCYPPYTEYYEVDLASGDASAIPALTAKPQPPGGGSGGGLSAGSEGTPFLGYTLLLALLGGIILNLMPCVFPVLSIKAMSLMSAAGSAHSHRVHGWAYTAGAVASFLLIGGIILGIRAAGGDADWGKQLQSPIFVAFMFYLFLVMGLSLSGFVQFGSNLMGLGQSLTTRQGLQGSFFTGVLAVVVASPCTAPFMAPALGVALTQTPTVALSVFAALGLGMALPFLALSYAPKLSRALPKPGPWMDTLKQFLAFPLYLTAVWLLWVLGRQTGIDAAAAVVVGAVAIAFALWLLQRRPVSKTGRTVVYAGVLASAFVALAVAVKSEDFGPADTWQPYSAQLVADLRSKGRPVFVNLTAAWCITCHANERVALGRDSVQDKARELDIALVKGDWTNEDPRITKLLHEYQRAGVPTYLMYPADPDAPAEILPQILTPGIVIAAMERAASRQVAEASL